MVTRRARIAAALGASALGIGLVEAALRLTWPALPSVAGLEGSDYRLEELVASEAGGTALCHEVTSFLSHRSRWGPQHAPGTRPPGPNKPPPGGPPLPGATVAATEMTFGEGTARSLWLVGDSVTFGLGVEAKDTFGATLARRLAETGAAVAYRNLGVPGAGYCTALRRLDTELSAAKPGDVVIVLYADDLEERSMLVVQGRLVAPPDLAENAVVRWLASRSYLANLAWYRAMSARGEEGRFLSEATLAEFRAAVVAIRDRVSSVGGDVRFVLLPAPSEQSCPPDKPDARCRWLADDLSRMADVLRAEDIDPIDLRGTWPPGVAHIVTHEHQSMRDGGVAMHPNEAGHALVAEAIWREWR